MLLHSVCTTKVKVISFKTEKEETKSWQVENYLFVIEINV